MTTPQATKIVIVAGQEFSVPAATDNEAIRTQLSGMGFTDVAAATISKGTREVDGQKVETIEFVKKAGTKGLDGAGLADLLSTLKPVALPPLQLYGPTPDQAELLDRLADGALTFDQALTIEPELAAALEACYDAPPTQRKEGAELCRTIDHLSPVAAAAPCAW